MNKTRQAVNYLLKAQSDLEQARILLHSEFPDGVCNRAYYALFDGILALLHTTDGAVSKTHTSAHTEFRKQFIQTGIFPKTYSDTITELFNLRQGGDYDVDFDISLDDDRDAVEKTTTFLSNIEAYLRQNGIVV